MWWALPIFHEQFAGQGVPPIWCWKEVYKQNSGNVSQWHFTSRSIQDHVLQSLKDPIGKVRIVIATNAFRMGVDIKGLHNATNYGPPLT